MTTFNEEVTAFLKSNGASLVGFANLKEINTEARQGFPFGISIAVALDPQIIAEIKEGPTKSYVEECLRADSILDSLSQLTVEFLVSRGYKAKQQAISNITGTRYPPKLTTPLPHKTVATRAGLGWIGKCALLITREFGSAVRLGSVLTDAKFSTGIPTDMSLCVDCTDCISICPAKAITGVEWHKGIERHALVDVFSCRKSARALLEKRTGGEIIGRTFCGLCIVACPWTQDYLKRAL
jgi:epoxyqueuosine reductase